MDFGVPDIGDFAGETEGDLPVIERLTGFVFDDELCMQAITPVTDQPEGDFGIGEFVVCLAGLGECGHEDGGEGDVSRGLAAGGGDVAEFDLSARGGDFPVPVGRFQDVAPAGGTLDFGTPDLVDRRAEVECEFPVGDLLSEVVFDDKLSVQTGFPIRDGFVNGPDVIVMRRALSGRRRSAQEEQACKPDEENRIWFPAVLDLVGAGHGMGSTNPSGSGQP